MMSHRPAFLTILISAFIIFFGQSCAHAGSSKKTINISDARRLVLDVVKAKYPSASINYYHNKNNVDFYSFEASWNNPKGSMIVGHFAVNSFTGDTWSIEGSVCSQLNGAALVQRQKAIRKRLRLNKDDYERFHTVKPVECD